jgi:hypothetical protein
LVNGIEAIRNLWKDAFERLPSLKYDLKSLTANSERVFMEYIRKVEAGEEYLLAAEVFGY